MNMWVHECMGVVRVFVFVYKCMLVCGFVCISVLVGVLECLCVGVMVSWRE